MKKKPIGCNCTSPDVIALLPTTKVWSFVPRGINQFQNHAYVKNNKITRMKSFDPLHLILQDNEAFAVIESENENILF